MNDARTGVAAHGVAELRGLADAPQCQIGALAHLECAAVPSTPSARAATRVTPLRASSAVSRNSVQAMFSISSIDVHGEVPGLLSVATAISTPAWRSSATGGGRVWRNV